MITRDQVATFAKQYAINQQTIVREYLQLWFLSRLYTLPQSNTIYFKGGTAIHLLFNAPRFSEDLDFTVEMTDTVFDQFSASLFEKLSNEEQITFKQRKTITGKRFLLTANPTILPSTVFINLDFSFREKVLDPQRLIINTDYPVLFTSHVYHLSKEEISAEKIRAIMTRKKGRDVYDLWYLLSQGVDLHNQFIERKLAYYHIKYEPKTIQERLAVFTEKEFIVDMRPFVPMKERDRLGSLFSYIKDYLNTHIF